jgi:hypothetical protein
MAEKSGLKVRREKEAVSISDYPEPKGRSKKLP